MPTKLKAGKIAQQISTGKFRPRSTRQLRTMAGSLLKPTRYKYAIMAIFHGQTTILYRNPIGPRKTRINKCMMISSPADIFLVLLNNKPSPAISSKEPAKYPMD